MDHKSNAFLETEKIGVLMRRFSIPFYMFGQAMNPIIRSDGNPRFAMIATVAGAVTNIILDPIFIFPMKMGMMGAVVATVIGQMLTAGLSVWYLFHMKAIKLEKDNRILRYQNWGWLFLFDAL